MIQGSGEVSSSEGTTQGDPLATAMYALAVRLLIDRLQSPCPTVKLVWYADTATQDQTLEIDPNDIFVATRRTAQRVG